MIKIGLILAAIVAIFMAGYFYNGMSTRIAVEKSRTKQAVLLVELEKAKAKREIRYIEKIKVVEKAVDDCLSRNAGPDILRLFDYRPAKP